MGHSCFLEKYPELLIAVKISIPMDNKWFLSVKEPIREQADPTCYKICGYQDFSCLMKVYL